MALIKVKVERFGQNSDGPFNLGFCDQTRPALVQFDTDGEQIELVDEDTRMCCLAEVRFSGEDGDIEAVPISDWHPL